MSFVSIFLLFTRISLLCSMGLLSAPPFPQKGFVVIVLLG